LLLLHKYEKELETFRHYIYILFSSHNEIYKFFYLDNFKLINNYKNNKTYNAMFLMKIGTTYHVIINIEINIQ